jgi:hypothetical protein
MRKLFVRLLGRGSDGSLHELKVNGEGELTAAIHEHPPIDETQASFPFKEFFTDENGSSNMVVNGSVTPVEFFIEANPDFDLYVKFIDIELTDTGMTDWDKFGDLAALTNGLEFVWKNNQTEDVIIDPEIKENKDFKRIATNEFDFVRISGAGADAMFPKIDMEILFGGRWGIRLRRGSSDRLSFFVKDDLTGINEFSINAYGRQV